jgi:hypothetical protein
MEFGDNNERIDICSDEGESIEFAYTSGDWDEENRFAIIDPSGDTVYQDGPSPSTGVVYSDQNICQDSIPSGDDTPEEEDTEEETTEEDDDLWDWGEPESADSFDATYDVLLYVHNSSSGYVICNEAVSITIQNDDLSNSVSCTTSTGLQLTYDLRGTTGSVYDSGEGYGYGYPEGEVDLTTPAGTTITADLFGECYNGSFLAMYMWWEHEVQTPSGPRNYGGYLYTE